MEDNATSKWISGIVLALVGLGWGITSLASGRLVIPYFSCLPLSHG
jgi:hypothetical protein